MPTGRVKRGKVVRGTSVVGGSVVAVTSRHHMHVDGKILLPRAGEVDNKDLRA
jgi:hypothetical protein